MEKSKFSKSMKKVMISAWNFVDVFNYSMSDALKLAWKLFKLRAEMAKGEVEFSYIKKDGSIRKAKGTTNLSFIPSDSSNFKGKGYQHEFQVRYFDIDSNGWRSFVETNLQ